MSDRSVGVAGATGALGTQIIEVLDKVKWRPEHLVPIASPATSVSFVSYGEEQLAVEVPDAADLADLDALFLAVPREVARELGERASADGAVVVDASGAMAEDADVPVVIPWVNPEALAGAARGIVAVPSAPAILLASVLGPLARAGVDGQVDATVIVSAADQGRGGIDELSSQVIALFNQGTPPRKVFPYGLAFDLHPQLGPLEVDGWTRREVSVAAAVQGLVGLSVLPAVTLVRAPLFSGVSASVSIRVDGHLDAGLVARILSDGGVRVPEESGERYVPRPRRVQGEGLVHVGRVRQDRSGHGVHLWAVMDELRGTAVVAVASAAALLRR